MSETIPREERYWFRKRVAHFENSARKLSSEFRVSYNIGGDTSIGSLFSTYRELRIQAEKLGEHRAGRKLDRAIEKVEELIRQSPKKAEGRLRSELDYFTNALPESEGWFEHVEVEELDNDRDTRSIVHELLELAPDFGIDIREYRERVRRFDETFREHASALARRTIRSDWMVSTYPEEYWWWNESPSATGQEGQSGA